MDAMPPDNFDTLDGPGWVGAARRPWRQQLAHAYRGVKLGLRGHSSFSVHFFFAALAVAAAVVLQCGWLEWGLLIGCIGLVWTAELFHSALDKLFHGLEPAGRRRTRPCLDIAAAAVLLASLTALTVGGLIFAPKLAALLLPP